MMIIIITIFINCNWVITRWQWLFYIYTNMKKRVIRKFKSGGLHERHVVAWDMALLLWVTREKQVFRTIVRPSRSAVRLFGLLNIHGLYGWLHHDRWIVGIRSLTNTSVTWQNTRVLRNNPWEPEILQLEFRVMQLRRMEACLRQRLEAAGSSREGTREKIQCGSFWYLSYLGPEQCSLAWVFLRNICQVTWGLEKKIREFNILR